MKFHIMKILKFALPALLICGLSLGANASYMGIRSLFTHVSGYTRHQQLPEYLEYYIEDYEYELSREWQRTEHEKCFYTDVIVKISRNGKLMSAQIYHPSKSKDFDKLALNAVRASAPFPPLPKSYKKSSIELVTTFRYIVPNNSSRVRYFY